MAVPVATTRTAVRAGMVDVAQTAAIRPTAARAAMEAAVGQMEAMTGTGAAAVLTVGLIRAGLTAVAVETARATILATAGVMRQAGPPRPASLAGKPWLSDAVTT